MSDDQDFLTTITGGQDDPFADLRKSSSGSGSSDPFADLRVAPTPAAKEVDGPEPEKTYEEELKDPKYLAEEMEYADPTPASFIFDMGKNVAGGVGKLFKLATGQSSTGITKETYLLAQKKKAGTAKLADYSNALLSQVEQNPLGQFASGVGSLIPGGALVGTGINKLVNPAVESVTGIDPNNLQAGEMLAGTALGAKYAPSASGEVAGKNALDSITGANVYKIPDDIIQGTATTPSEGTATPASEDIVKSNISTPLTADSIKIPNLVPGVKYTLAQATGDPNLAVLERQLSSLNPGPFNALKAANNKARLDYLGGITGTAEDVASMEATREANASPLYKEAETQQLDPTAISPVLTNIDAAIERVGAGSEAGKTLLGLKSDIQSAMPKMVKNTSPIIGPDGNPVSTPKFTNTTQSPLIQIYRETRDNLNKPSQQQGAYGATVKSVIQPINASLGQALESQSPSFAKGQQIYRDESPSITAAKYLQGLNLKDDQGNITLAKVNNAYENAVKLKNTAPSTHPIHSLSDEQLGALKNLRDDLRIESNSKKGLPTGSPTVQNAVATAKLNSLISGQAGGKISHETVGTAIGTGVGSILGIPAAGSFLGDIGGRLTAGIGKARSQAALNLLEQRMIDAQAYKNRLMNQSRP